MDLFSKCSTVFFPFKIRIISLQQLDESTDIPREYQIARNISILEFIVSDNREHGHKKDVIAMVF